MKSMWKDGVMGVVIGDALGCPVQFKSRAEVAKHPITGMRGNGTFNLPAGSWTDDSSLTLALLDSIKRLNTIDLHDIMNNFVQWMDNGAFTPFGHAFDIGRGTMNSILKYKREKNPLKCGSCDERNNGNGSLMRIMPVCLFCVNKRLNDDDAIRIIHQVGSLTHAHLRSNIACGLYYFMVKAILENDGTLLDRLQTGLNHGFSFYKKFLVDQKNVGYYDRLKNLTVFAGTPEDAIKSSGYVVDTLEAAVWSLLNTNSFDSALLLAVNLGDDSDTVAAIAGGLAGLFYGYDAIPKNWLQAIQKRDMIDTLCCVSFTKARWSCRDT